MKRLFIVLAVVVGSGICSFILIASKDVDTVQNNADVCFHHESHNDACYCPNCEVELRQVQEKTPKYSRCNVCGGDGKMNCTQQEWQECSSCRGTGCKNGYTTDNGKYCAYGHCTYCGGQGGKKRNVMRDVCECTSSSCKEVYIDGHFMGFGSIVYDFYYVYKCSKCGRTFSGC